MQYSKHSCNKWKGKYIKTNLMRVSVTITNPNEKENKTLLFCITSLWQICKNDWKYPICFVVFQLCLNQFEIMRNAFENVPKKAAKNCAFVWMNHKNDCAKISSSNNKLSHKTIRIEKIFCYSFLYVNIRFFVSQQGNFHSIFPNINIHVAHKTMPNVKRMMNVKRKWNDLILNTIIFPKWLTFMALNFDCPLRRNDTRKYCIKGVKYQCTYITTM